MRTLTLLSAVFFGFSRFRLFFFCISTNSPALVYFFASWFFLNVEQIAPRQLSMSNVVDSGVLLGSVPCFLPCLSAKTPTARPFGPALQALNFPGLHSVTRVPFFPSVIVSASISYCWLPSHPCAQWPRPSYFRRPIDHRYVPDPRALTVVSSMIGVLAPSSRGVGESIASLSFVSNSRTFDPVSNVFCMFLLDIL